jgi:hypothetical protein
MKKTIITTLIFICTLYTVNAQQHIDNMQLNCLYKYNYTYNTLRSTYTAVDTMQLEIGNKVCKFYSLINATGSLASTTTIENILSLINLHS